jgi:NTE family protein
MTNPLDRHRQIVGVSWTCPQLVVGLVLFSLLALEQARAQEGSIERRPTIGVAFEGGGALGLGHVGVLEWLEKKHIPVDYVAGTSMGGLVGGLYAAGNSPAEIRLLMRGIDWNEVVGGRIPFQDLSYRRKEDQRAYPNDIELGLRHGLSLPGGLNSGQQVKLILDRAALPYSFITSFDELPIPFRCVATDLGTGTAHVFKDGSLSEALRATMSLPAIFTPVVTKEGKIFVDGGLMNNLPVDVVKAMGADIVIAIYLETSPFDPKTAQSLFSVAGQTVNVMIAANERHNMEAADILVTVNLSGYTSMDYNAADKIADKGYEGAEKKASLLSRLAVNDAAWQEYVTRRTARRIRTVPTPQFVKVQGTSPQLASELEKSFANAVGSPVDTDVLDKQLVVATGTGRFSSLSYQMVQRDGQDGLLIDTVEKTYAPPILQPGIVIDGSQYNNPLFSVGARLTVMDWGGFGSQWRTDVSVGAVYSLNSEYYRPFTKGSRWFYAPRILASSSPLNLYSQGKQLAEYGIGHAAGEFDIGYAFNRYSEFRLGYDMGYERATLRVGSPDLPRIGGQLSSSSIQYNLINVDDPVIPMSGEYLTSSYQYIDHAPGTSEAYSAAQMNALVFHRISKKGSLFLGGEGGSTFGHHSGIPQYFLGGGLRLGAYGENEIPTDQYFLFRVGYIREIAQLNPLFGGKIYLLAFGEVAKPYGDLLPDVSPPHLPADVNGGVVVKTLFGPLFLAGAYGESGNHKIYFQLGRVF